MVPIWSLYGPHSSEASKATFQRLTAGGLLRPTHVTSRVALSPGVAPSNLPKLWPGPKGSGEFCLENYEKIKTNKFSENFMIEFLEFFYNSEFCLDYRKTQKFIETTGFLRSKPPFLAGTRLDRHRFRWCCACSWGQQKALCTSGPHPKSVRLTLQQDVWSTILKHMYDVHSARALTCRRQSLRRESWDIATMASLWHVPSFCR